MALRVTQAFGSYAVGDTITDTAEIKAVTDSEQATFVVAVADAPPPAPAPAPSAPATSKE
jgi:hypothetical protein